MLKRKLSFEIAVLLLKLKGIQCSCLKGRECLEVVSPCCLYCKYLKECYEKYKDKDILKSICKLDKELILCKTVRNRIKKLEEEIGNG